MTAPMTSSFADLDDFDSVRTVASKTERFTCLECNGSGRYRGVRVHQDAAECFACGGRGFHDIPHHQAMQRRRDRKAKQEAGRAKAHDERVAVFEAGNPGLYSFLMGAAEWSGFARDMLGKIGTPAGLTAGQTAACRNMQEKAAARTAERAAEKAKSTTAVDLSPIAKMFDAAKASGHKRPAYRAEGLKISPAPNHGRNAGALYVVDIETDQYLGKIVGEAFQPSREGRDAAAKLLAIAADPKSAAVAYGKKYGICSCCGRELSDPNSVAAGIGPICATGWGF